MVLKAILWGLVPSSSFRLGKPTWEPMQPLTARKSLNDRVESINFGYECDAGTAVAQRRLRSLQRIEELAPRGCGQIVNSAYEPFKDSALPCSTTPEGSCPYLRFRCQNGHEWKASPGTTACVQCPICNTSKKEGLGSSTQLMRQKRLSVSLAEYVVSHGGAVMGYSSGSSDSGNGNEEGSIGTRSEGMRNMEAITRFFSANVQGDLNRTLHWTSRVDLRCSSGHGWDATITNLIKHRTWCPHCHKLQKSLSTLDYEKTAAHFDGAYLGQVSADCDAGVPFRKQRSIWRCAEGHKFTRHINNIRRRPGGRRRPSWCKECAKQGKVFVWNPELRKEKYVDVADDVSES